MKPKVDNHVILRNRHFGSEPVTFLEIRPDACGWVAGRPGDHTGTFGAYFLEVCYRDCRRKCKVAHYCVWSGTRPA
jgi:hypothetical protein